MGMHSIYEHFPLECSFNQEVHKGYRWRKAWLYRDRNSIYFLPPGVSKTGIPAYKEHLLERNIKVEWDADDVEDVLVAEDKYDFSEYNAFSVDDLISSLRNAVNDVRNGKNKKMVMKKWVTQHGFLGVNMANVAHAPRPEWETLTDFWREAEKLTTLWDKYEQVTRRDIKNLKEWIRFVPLDEFDEFDPFLPFAQEGYASKSMYAPFPNACVRTFGAHDVYYRATLREIEENPLPFYQIAGHNYVITEISHKLSILRLGYNSVKKIENPQDDTFKINPILAPHSLLEAMYLQFYILLCGQNVKVCKNCGKPFSLTRKYSKNRVYCSESCKHTAKSRAYRERKRLKAINR